MVVNETKESVLAKNVWVAKNLFERLRGLIGSPQLLEDEGLLIPSCHGIHTFGMNYPIDVIYLDKSGRVMESVIGLKPNSFGPVNFHAHSVLELSEGTIERSKTQKGDLLCIADISSFLTSNKPSKKILSFLSPLPRTV